MARSTAQTVAEYLDSLPAERREVVSSMRDLILRNLPAGYEEAMSTGIIVYQIPLARYPKTYNGQALWYVALAAQKNYYSLYLMGSYQDSDRQLREGFEKAGKKLDMGKSCVRFRKLEDLALEVISQNIAGTTPEQFIERYESVPRERK
jgi:uncharacterized protein DUF1801